MLPPPRPKRRHCAPGTLHLSPLTTARKPHSPPGRRNAQPASARKSARQPCTRHAQPACHCAQDRTPAGYAQRSTRPPLRTRPHSPQGRRNAQPVHHCAQDHPASRVRAMLNPPATAQNRTAVGQPPRSARPPLRAKPHSPWGMRHVQPVAGDVKTSQSRLT